MPVAGGGGVGGLGLGRVDGLGCGSAGGCGPHLVKGLAQWYAQGKIKPVIDRTMPMAELPAAYAHMGSRGVMGKLVMVN